MDWITRLTAEESHIKGLVERLRGIRGSGLRARIERGQIARALNARISMTGEFLQDCLTGRSSQEQSLMKFRVRMEFPLYSHLHSIVALENIEDCLTAGPAA